MNIREQIDRLKAYDESLSHGVPPRDGWWLVYEDLQKAADTMEAMYEALERNTQEIHRYKHIERGHHCGWRVIAEAMIERSREALAKLDRR